MSQKGITNKYILLLFLIALAILPTPAIAFRVISFGDALEIDHSHSISFASRKLDSLSYQYVGQDSFGTCYWVQGCALNKDYHVNTKNGSDIPIGASVVSYNPHNPKIGLIVKMFHEQEVRTFAGFLELCNYTSQPLEKDLGVYEWKNSMHDVAASPIYMVIGKTYADNYYHGYVFIFGGEVSPSIDEVKKMCKSDIASYTNGGDWFGLLKSVVTSDLAIYILMSLVGLVCLYLFTGGKLSEVGSLTTDLLYSVIISAILYVALYISMHIGVYVALLKNMLPDYKNMFIVINGFSVVGFISGLIGMFWNAVWAGASVAFPVIVALSLASSHKTTLGRIVMFIMVVTMTIYAIHKSYMWVTSVDAPLWGSSKIDYYTLFISHCIGGCFGLYTGFNIGFSSHKHS